MIRRLAILAVLPLLSGCAVIPALTSLITPSVEAEVIEEGGTLAVEGIEALETHEETKITSE